VKMERGQIPVLGLRFILTVLFSTRALKGTPVPDINSIISPLKKGVEIPEYDILAQEF